MKSWCKVASNLDSHPKIMKAGRLGREVFLFALRRNAEPGNPVPGRLPKEELSPEYLSRILDMPVTEAVTGVTAAVTAGLLREDEEGFAISSWKEGWGKVDSTNAERQRRHRERQKEEDSNADGSLRNVTRNARNTDQKRSDKKNTPSEVDLGLARSLLTRVVKNHPGSVEAKSTPAEQEQTIVRWANSIRLMRERDGHSPEEIQQVISFSQDDSFWFRNILSADTLRKQWTKLVAKMRGDKPAATPVKKSSQPDLVFVVNGVEVER